MDTETYGGDVPHASVRVGVIGLGMGRDHVINYLQAPNCELVAVCDKDPNRLEALGNEFGIPTRYSSYEQMLDDDRIDAVSIVLPNFLHRRVAVEALQAGKHVLCEKPMALNAVEAAEMRDRAARSKRIFMMHFNFRFHHQSQWLYHRVQEGRLGDIYYVKTGWIRRRGIPGLGGWFTTKAHSGGGPLIDLAVHRIDLVLWLLGYPKVRAVSGQTFAKIAPQIAEKENATFDVEDLATAMIRLENDVTIQLEASWALNTPEWEYWYTDLFGTHGGGELRRNNEGHSWARVVEDRDGHWHEEWHDGSPVATETAQSHFVRCILEGKEPMATADHGLTVMRILDAIYESADSSREIALDDEPGPTIEYDRSSSSGESDG